MNTKQLIIIGGGTSINEGIKKGLWKNLETKFTFGLNYSYRYYQNSTCQLYVDDNFYKEEIQKELKNHPLIIGKHHASIAKIVNPNTIMLPPIAKYYRNIANGIYKSSLCGLFALTLGIYLLDEGEIFLLGYDYSGQGKDEKNRTITHFYQEDKTIRHRGIGKINYYTTKGRAEKDFEPYKNEKKVKIYNVSMISKIPTFPKITYDDFFKLLDTTSHNQDQLRDCIKEKLRKVEKK